MSESMIVMSKGSRYAKAVVAALAMTWCCGAALAQGQQPAAGAVRQACAADLQTYCSGVQPGGGRIKACLRQNADKLSPACKTALRNAKAARQGGG